MSATRRGIHAKTLLVAVLGLVVTGTAFAHVHFVAQPEVSAAADQYATLTFPLSGEGSYRFEIVPPHGWTAVTRNGEVELRGDGFVSVTVRVPTFAPAGERSGTELRLLDGERLIASATGHVTVARRVEISLQVPDELTGSLGAPLTFDVVVGNEGNVADTLLLSARHCHWDVRFDSAAPTLEAGERRIVSVTLRPTTTVNSGYRQIFYLVATSDADPSVEVVTEVTSRFYLSGTSFGQRASDRPQLTLSVGAGVAVGLIAADGEVATSASYYVRPGLTGQLSDFVDGSLQTNRLAGTLADPFAEIPSSLALSLRGQDWDGSIGVSPQRYAVGFGADLAGWRVSADGSITPGHGVGAAARLESSDRALQVTARTSSLGGRRTDALMASYGTDLMDDLALTVGAGISGFAGLGDRGDYELALTLSQRLAWQNERYDVSQSYAGVPFAGLHTVGLSGGSRRLYPFGVRAQTAYSVSPVSSRWSSGVTLYGGPAPGLTIDVTGGVIVEGAGARSGVTWSVSPRLGYALRLPGGVSATFAVRYGHGGVLAGRGTSWDRYEAGMRVGYRDVGLAASAAYEVRRSDGADGPDASLRVSVQPEYVLTGDARLFASYRYEERTSPVARVRHELGVGWTHTWSPTVASRLEYERTFDMLGDASRERIGLSVGVMDVMTPGLHLSAGYAVTSRTSLLDFATPPTHDLRVGVGYAIPIVFDTPDALIELFGGRRGGEVHGVAFLDADRTGALGPADRPLAGLEIRIGSERTTTAADGSYRLRVAAGNHDISFPAGLPATMDLRGERTIVVVENERHELPLAFAPVVSLTVELFDDRDHGGVPGAAAAGIAYGGVVLDGPERRVVRTDASGRAIVSGLLAGTYAVAVSAAHLPSGYRATSEPVSVTLRPGERPTPVRLGAARPPRTVAHTFSTGTLAVLPRALQSSVAPGAEIELEALVQGDVERVSVTYGGGEAVFAPSGSSWRVHIRIPREAPVGPLELVVRAEGGGNSLVRPLYVNVVDRPPFAASGVVAAAGKDAHVEVVTLFRANEASLVMPEGDPVELASEDGYRWLATWRAPSEAGRFYGSLIVDGEELGQIAFSVFAPPESQRETGLDSEVDSAAARRDQDGVDDFDLAAAGQSSARREGREEQ